MFHAVARITKSSTVYPAVKKYSLATSWLAAASASATAKAMAAKTLLLIGSSSSEQARGTEGECGEQEAEGDGRRPRRAEKGGGERLGDAEHEGAEQRPPDRSHAAQHAHGEREADVLASDRRLDRLDDDQERARNARGRDREPEGELFHPDRIHAHQAQGELILRDREHRPPEESV